MPVAWDSPDAFKGAIKRYEAVPILTGTAYSSHAANSIFVQPLLLAEPVVVSNINVVKSMNAVVPSATSAASQGSNVYAYSHGVTIFVRQDYSNNSTNLVTLGTASVGITASLSYTSTGQSMGLSWVTNNTGGTSGLTTQSNAGGWSSYLTGQKVVAIPWVTTLSAGEYWLAHAHSSSTSTSNSNFTLLSVSNLHVAPQFVNVGLLGQTVTAQSLPSGMGAGVASALTTTTGMAASVISASVYNPWVANLSAV